MAATGCRTTRLLVRRCFFQTYSAASRTPESAEAVTLCPCRLILPTGTASRQNLTSRQRQVWMWFGTIYPPGALHN